MNATVGIEQDLDRIGIILDELGQLTPTELRESLGLCEEHHLHRSTCDPKLHLITYLHGRIPWGPIWVKTEHTLYIEFSLPDTSGGRMWRRIPWPPALYNIFFH